MLRTEGRVDGRWLMMIALAPAIAGCLTPREATQVDIYVDAQPLVRGESRSLEVRVLAGPRGDLSELPDIQVYDQASLRWPIDFTLVPLGDDVSRIFEVEATALDAAGRTIGVARLRGGFVEHSRRTLRLTLEDRCRGITCAAGFTCRSGGCVALIDPTQDGGIDLDAGVLDAPPVTCSGSVESCDDGVFCNGAEQCQGGTCQPGALPDCDDGVACTDDLCTGDGCNPIPNDALCTIAAGGRCDATTGCQYPTCDVVTTCAPAACETTRCDGTTCVRASTCAAGTECCGDRCLPTDCEDTNECTVDYCSVRGGMGMCNNERLDTGSCDDHDACTTGDTCSGGRCSGTPRAACNDMNPCTRDSCDPSSGCQFANDDGLSYDDGDACTVGDRCSGGVPIPGAPMDCTDAHFCTIDSCEAGACVHAPLDARCPGIGARCDVMYGCQTGACMPSSCMPTSSCETATCAGAICEHRPLCLGLCCSGSCCTDDGNPCTDAVCGAGGCSNVPNAMPCNDGDDCTIGDRCTLGACVGTASSCTGPNPCRAYSCSGGACTSAPVANGTPCNDGNACTVTDLCSAGTCVPGAVRTCTDTNPCTSQVCNPSTGNCDVIFEDPGFPCGLGDPDFCTLRVCDGAGICDLQSTCTSTDSECCPGGFCAPFGNCPPLCYPPGTC